MSVCAGCDRMPPRSGVPAFLAKVLGPRWWAVSDADEACAELIVVLQRDGICARHAAWLATLARLRIIGEARRRALVPGLVLVLYGEIAEDACDAVLEDVCDAVPEDAGCEDAIVADVRRFVAGSPLAAVVELDLQQRLARITLQIAGSEPLQTMQVEHRRLAHLTAGEVFDGLRQRAAAG